MPIIPKQPQLQGEIQNPIPSAGSVVAVSHAASGFGEMGLNIGLEINAVRERVDQVKRADIINEARLRFAEAKTEHAKYRASNLDQNTWEPDLDTKLSGAWDRVNAEVPMPADMRKAVDTQWKLWSQDSRYDTAVDAISATAKRARLNVDTLAQNAETNEDWSGAAQEYDNAAAVGTLTPEEAAAKKSDIAVRQKKWGLDQQFNSNLGEINSKPSDWLERNPTRPEGMDEPTFSQLTRHARSTLTQKSADVVDRIQDKITSATTPLRDSDIEDMGKAEGVRPTIINSLKEFRNSYASDEFRRQMADPNTQRRLYSEINSEIANWNKVSDNAPDETYASIVAKINTLPTDNGYAAEARARLAKIKAEGRSDSDTYEYGTGLIKQHGDLGGFGTRHTPTGIAKGDSVSTAKMISDGFLSNPDKLMSLGFNEIQVRSITGRSKKDGGWVFDKEDIGGTYTDGKWNKGATFDDKKARWAPGSINEDEALNSMKTAVFRDQWVHRTFTSNFDKADPAAKAVAMAIVNRESSFEVPAPDGVMQQRRLQDQASRIEEGKRLEDFDRKYRDLRRRNGEKGVTSEEANEIVRGITGKLPTSNRKLPTKGNEGTAGDSGLPGSLGHPLSMRDTGQDMGSPAVKAWTEDAGPQVLSDLSGGYTPLPNAVPGNSGIRSLPNSKPGDGKLIPLNDIKLSNYGYAGDTYSDTNSAAGIGHSDNRLVDGMSVALTASLAKQYGIARGDRLRLHTTKGIIEAVYDDTVPTKTKDGKPLPPTFDLYRKSNGSNGWSGKVTGFEKL